MKAVKILKTLIAIPALLALAFQSFASQHPKAFDANDKVLFVGDSITAGGYYIKHIMLYYITRFPNAKACFINSGISGDYCDGLLWRMDWDILSNKPDVATLMIGMNDVSRNSFSTSEKAKPMHKDRLLARRKSYAEKLSKIIGALSENSRSLIVFTPSIYDQSARIKCENLIGVNDELSIYGNIGAELASNTGNARVVDMSAAMAKTNLAYQNSEGSDKTIIGPDRVHPGDVGGLVMAKTFIESFGESPTVYNLHIDAPSQSVKYANNCEVQDLKSDTCKTTFSLREESLPYPFTAETEKIDKYINFTETFNLQKLKISSLPVGDYSLEIDGKEVGIYSSEDFSKGINLSKNRKTPQYAQAMEVLKLCEQFRNLNVKYRSFFLPELFTFRECYGKDAAQRMEIIKEKYLKIKANKNSNPYVLKCFKNYIENQREREMLPQKIKNVLDCAYNEAQAKSHIYTIKLKK